MRTYGEQRWNWSSRANKWVYVYLKNGKRVYKYQDEAPNEYDEITNELKQLNLDLLEEQDEQHNKAIYMKMIELSKRLQALKSKVS